MSYAASPQAASVDARASAAPATTLYHAGIYRECAAGLADQVRNYLEKAEREGRLRQALNERGSSRGRGLLHVAALNNQLECLDVLLHDFGAPRNPRSSTATHHCEVSQRHE